MIEKNTIFKKQTSGSYQVPPNFPKCWKNRFINRTQDITDIHLPATGLNAETRSHRSYDMIFESVK